MNVLALDASADIVAAAILIDDQPAAERARIAPRPHSESLCAAVEGVLGDARVTLGDVDLIAVATGPGSFNGIRGAIATAQGLALALDVPVAGIPTLDAIAYPWLGCGATVIAVLSAGRGEFYGAAYEGTWSAWRRRGAYAVGPLDSLLDGYPNVLVCGRLPAAAVTVLSDRGLRCAPACALFSRATVVGALALQRAATAGDGEIEPPRPLYLREPGITRPARRLSATVAGTTTAATAEGEAAFHGSHTS